jgi:hypothetical protein
MLGCSCLPADGVEWALGNSGFGLYECVDICIWRNCLRVISMVVFSELSMDVEYLYCVLSVSLFAVSVQLA